MTDDRILALEREIERLRAEVADLRKALMAESDDTTKNIISINKRTVSICENVNRHSDWLTTLIYKFMPEHKAARDQIDSIFCLSDDRPNPRDRT